eukprot:2539358-Pyramimonas_sp.AAC.1
MAWRLMSSMRFLIRTVGHLTPTCRSVVMIISLARPVAHEQPAVTVPCERSSLDVDLWGITRQRAVNPGRFVTRRVRRGSPEETAPEGALPFGHFRMPRA